MPRTHSPHCQATCDRATLIRELYVAAGRGYQPMPFVQGTQEELERVWSILEGIYHEYHDDGDQMSDACTCGYFERADQS